MEDPLYAGVISVHTQEQTGYERRAGTNIITEYKMWCSGMRTDSPLTVTNFNKLMRSDCLYLQNLSYILIDGKVRQQDLIDKG